MYAIIYLLLSALIGYLGKDRKFGFWGYFACAVIFTPIIGLIIVLASDRKKPAIIVEPQAQ
jgi:hypothetical protein